jgi:4-amino-4-deoxy-L-arabinose transferase-like glycosyltransferase
MPHSRPERDEPGGRAARAPRRVGLVRVAFDVITQHPVTCVIALALLTRLAAALAVGGGFRFFDETEYIDAAQRLLVGQGFAPKYMKEPAYAVLLGILMSPLPGNLLFLRLAQAVVATLGVVLVFAVGRRFFGHVPALLAALCYALDPLSVVAAALFYPEALAAVALLAAVLSTLNAVRDDRLGWSATAGALLGVLIQLRAVALVLLPVLMAWSILGLPAATLRRRTLHALTIAAVAGLALVPWTYRNYVVHGRLVLVSLSGSFNAPVRWRPEAKQSGLASSLVRRIYDDPTVFVQRTLQQFGYFWELSPTRLLADDPQWRAGAHQIDERLPADANFTPSLRDGVSAVSFGFELLFALLGVLVASLRRIRGSGLLVALVIAYALGFSLFFAKMRYRITVLPEVFMFAGVGIAMAWEAVRTVRIGTNRNAVLRKESHS